MILHFLAMVSILPIHPVSTSTEAEVSAILPSTPGPVLHRSLHNPIHIAPSHHHFRRFALSCSSSHDFNILSSAPQFSGIIQNT